MAATEEDVQRVTSALEILERPSQEAVADAERHVNIISSFLIKYGMETADYPELKSLVERGFGVLQWYGRRGEPIVPDDSPLFELSEKKYFEQLSDDERVKFVKALRHIYQHETAASWDRYEEFRPLYESLTADGQIDGLLLGLLDHAQSDDHKLACYYAKELDGQLTPTRFLQSSIRGRDIIVRATLLRLTHKRLDRDSRFSQSMCYDYVSILRESNYWDMDRVQQVVTWFDHGAVSDYPQWWLDCASLQAICDRVVNYEFGGEALNFYRSDHFLIECICDREWIDEEDQKLLATIAIERLSYFKDSSADKYHDKMMRVILSNHYSAPALQQFQQNSNVDKTTNIASWLTPNDDQSLRNFWITSDDVTQNLTKEKYDKAHHADQKIMLQAALARLQYGMFVDVAKFTPQQNAQYLRIVISANIIYGGSDQLQRDIDDVLRCYEFIENLSDQAQLNHNVLRDKEGQFCDSVLSFFECSEPLEDEEQALASKAIIEDINFIKKYVDEKCKAFMDATELPSPVDETNLVGIKLWKDLKKEETYNERTIKELLDKIKSHICSPSFRGDVDEIELYLNFFTPEGRFDDRFIMYVPAVEQRYAGLKSDFNVINDDVSKPRQWRIDAPSNITTFLTEKHFNEGSIERKLLFIKAMVCLCECKPRPVRFDEYVGLMLKVHEDAVLMKWIKYQKDLAQRMIAITNRPERLDGEDEVSVVFSDAEQDEKIEEKVLGMGDDDIWSPALFQNSSCPPSLFLPPVDTEGRRPFGKRQ